MAKEGGSTGVQMPPRSSEGNEMRNERAMRTLTHTRTPMPVGVRGFCLGIVEVLQKGWSVDVEAPPCEQHVKNKLA